MTELPYPEGNDRTTAVKDFAHFVETRTDSVPRNPLFVAAARYLQEAEDVRAPAAKAAKDLHGCRAVLALILGHSNSEVSAKIVNAVEVLRRVAGTEPTTPRQAVAGLSEAIQEADEAADRVNKALTAALGDVKDALAELVEPGPPAVATVDYLTSEGLGILDRAIAAIDGRPADKANGVPKFAVPDIKVYAEREIARIAKEFDVDLTAFATKVADPAPVWVVKEPGVRVLTGTSFEMRVAFNGDRAFIHTFRDGGLFGDSHVRFSVAEEAVADYINTNRETLVAFGFINQETRT
ncbi:hypothetical protein UFOVP786_32 [uncultured Caudovirales phage]|uniref:Uncharacterized protein n=1 Tax=uncultured Caudovirales phage TaxID=2100421 RepID=A0A6J5NTH7_9CAUD|nr:hypothetical protein UFOVP786_32 [uncultured Caudovirales phage]